MKKSIEQVEVRGKRALARVDFDVPLDDHSRIADDRRIRAAVPTVRKLVERGARVVLLAHMGRPKNTPEDRRKHSLRPCAERLSELLGHPVRFVPVCVGAEAEQAVNALRDGEVILLENLRFHEEEQVKDKDAAKDADLRRRKDEFARQLASLGDVYVNDAFATCHRDNASMLTLPMMMRDRARVAGEHLQKELSYLTQAVARPDRPFVCVLGGAKVSDKLGVIKSLLGKCDTILIGGAMAYTFLAAEGLALGKSRTEPDLYETARQLRKSAEDRLRLPLDSVAATEIASDAATMICDGEIPAQLMGLDIGPKTVKAFSDVIATAQTVVWNGPMGVFETPPFDQGTIAIAHALAGATDRGATTIIGGGDSAAAVDHAGLSDRMSHISTGGGASLELLEGKKFAALDALEDAP